MIDSKRPAAVSGNNLSGISPEVMRFVGRASLKELLKVGTKVG